MSYPNGDESNMGFAEFSKDSIAQSLGDVCLSPYSHCDQMLVNMNTITISPRALYNGVPSMSQDPLHAKYLNERFEMQRSVSSTSS